MTGYYSRPARLARQMRQLLFPRRCPCCRRVLGTLPFCEVCTPRLEELRRGPVMRLDASRHYLGALDGAAAPYRYEGVVRSAILRAKYDADGRLAEFDDVTPPGSKPYHMGDIGGRLFYSEHDGIREYTGTEWRPIANGIVTAARETHLAVPLVVRMKGTNEDLGKQILKESGLPIISADTMAEAAQKIVDAVK